VREFDADAGKGLPEPVKIRWRDVVWPRAGVKLGLFLLRVAGWFFAAMPLIVQFRFLALAPTVGDVVGIWCLFVPLVVVLVGTLGSVDKSRPRWMFNAARFSVTALVICTLCSSLLVALIPERWPVIAAVALDVAFLYLIARIGAVAERRAIRDGVVLTTPLFDSKRFSLNLLLFTSGRAVYVVATVLQAGFKHGGRHFFLGRFAARFFDPLQVFARAVDEFRRRINAKSVGEVISLDNRPPVLLLRSFRDDGISADRQEKTFLGSFLSFEEELAVPLSIMCGPVIAIGQPGERRPRAGAAREYVSHEVWRDHVAERMCAAGVIVVVIGETPGLAWEVAKVRELGLLDRLVLLFPAVKDREAKRRLGILCSGLPATDNFPDRIYASFCKHALAIAFQGEVPIVYKGFERRPASYKVALERIVAGVEGSAAPAAENRLREAQAQSPAACAHPDPEQRLPAGSE
jgi:hypothetical protein